MTKGTGPHSNGAYRRRPDQRRVKPGTAARAKTPTGRATTRVAIEVRAAADILYALASPHTHQLLRRHCRWTTQRYRAWLTEAVTLHLLAGS
jgi:hypothetical protein